MITRTAHAKLNVFLRVLGRRDDGYHDVETVILPLELHDLVTVEPAEELEVVVTGERADELTSHGGESLVARAAHAWSGTAGVGAPRARITVDKRIPVAAGLGGGSADAAATILALDELHGSALDPGALLEAAAAVGSDVPALLLGGPVFAEGRGDRVVPVHAATTTGSCAPSRSRCGPPTPTPGGTPRRGPDPTPARWWPRSRPATRSSWAARFSTTSRRRSPPGIRRIAATIEAFLAAGALGAVMTGSGPSVVALARHPMHADALCAAVPGSFATSGPPRTMDAPSGVV